MELPRIQAGRRKRSHEIAELIESAIVSGEFEVGSKLPSEKELAERFGVGRPSVREALFLLQQQGFVEISSGARAQVTSPNAKFLTDQLAGLVKRTAARGQGQAYMEQARLLFEAGVAWQAAQSRPTRTSPASRPRSTPMPRRSATPPSSSAPTSPSTTS